MADHGALMELLRQTERQLDGQDAGVESGLRRAGELLRLAIASVGGVVVVAGVLTTGGVKLNALGLSVLTAGTALLVTSAVLLARLLAGGGIREPRGLALGPDIGATVPLLEDPAFTLDALVGSLLEAAPGWLADNKTIVRDMEQRRGQALRLMIFGVSIDMLGLLYIVGGTILG